MAINAQVVDRLRPTLTPQAVDVLTGAQGSSALLRSLVELYETKAERYLRLVAGSEMSALTKEEREKDRVLLTKKVSDSVHALFFNLNQMSFLPYVHFSLHKDDLSKSLGLQGNDNVINDVLVKYTARFHIYTSLGHDLCTALCQAVSEENGPAYISNALIVSFAAQRILNAHLIEKRQEDPTISTSSAINHVIENRANIWSQGLFGVISYLGEVLHGMRAEGGLQDPGFDHLDGGNNQREFALLITRGLTETPKDKITTTIEAVNRASEGRLYSNSVSAASLLGIRSSSWRAVLDIADQRIGECREKVKKELSENLEKLRTYQVEAYNGIDQALKNFKPSWYVQAGPMLI